jgi:hypothetical protein
LNNGCNMITIFETKPTQCFYSDTYSYIRVLNSWHGYETYTILIQCDIDHFFTQIPEFQYITMCNTIHTKL